MIRYVEGNIFDSPAQVIVNTVNTVGVMGKGLALEFKRRYPDMFTKYRIMCEKHQLTIGKLMLVHEPDHLLLLFPTKENWRNPSRLEYIEKGLMKFVNTYADKNIYSIAFPRLGCGNGELAWEDVKPIMEKYLSPLPIDVIIYLGVTPDLLPEHKQIRETMNWLKENAKDLSFDGLRDDIKITCAILPYEFSFGRETVVVNYMDGLHFFIAEKEICFVKEDDFYAVWDHIRTESIVAEDDITANKLIYNLLVSMGYMTPVRIVDEKTGSRSKGFQVNEGLGRYYAIRGGCS